MPPSIERCPNCHTKHEIGEYKLWEEDGKRIAAPPDIFCCCEFWLQPVVPLFKVTQSGYELRIISADKARR